jgi:hypothetical protein
VASDRLFQVIVLGGIALVGGACGGRVVVDGDGSSGVGGARSTGSGGSGVGGVPSSGPSFGGFNPATTGQGGFPSEGPVLDAGVDGFPTEGDPIADAGQDGFPQEAPH